MLIIFIVIVSPAFFWILFFYYKDRFQPEPLVDLGGSYLLGFISAYLCYKFYFILQLWDIPFDISPFLNGSSTYLFVYLTMVTGIVEEFFKLIPFIITLKLFSNFDEKLDSIVYSSVIAIGFSSYENLIHIKYLNGFELYARGIASPLTHTIFASIWGYYFYMHFIEKKYSIFTPLAAFFISATLHGLYDFLSFSDVLRIISSLLILAIWIWRIILIEKLQKEYKKLKRINKRTV